jgi:hypothetical protein
MPNAHPRGRDEQYVGLTEQLGMIQEVGSILGAGWKQVPLPVEVGCAREANISHRNFLDYVYALNVSSGIHDEGNGYDANPASSQDVNLNPA